MLEVLYTDNDFIAINKPHGLLVHRTKLADEATSFALQIVRDQIGRRVFPVHRIDRKTGGILLFALHETALKMMNNLFMERRVEKTYLAIVRGYCDDTGIIDYPIKKENGKLKESVTEYKTINKVELDIQFGNHPTSRYSLVEIYPKSGRMHQIRKHFKHIRHPIIGDRPYGCNKQNKMFKEKWNITQLLLHAAELKFFQPITNKSVEISAPLQKGFTRVNDILGF
jgi:tRNA pseudouridine65 synthase